MRSFDPRSYNVCPEAYGDHGLYVDPEDKRFEQKLDCITIDQSYVSMFIDRPMNPKNRYRTISDPIIDRSVI